MRVPEAARGCALVDTFRVNRGSLGHSTRNTISWPVVSRVTRAMYGVEWVGPVPAKPASPGELLEYRWDLYFEAQERLR